MKLRSLVYSILIVLMGCTLFSSNSQELSFENVRQLRVGKATKQDIRDRFGNPDKESSYDGKAIPEIRGEFWDYFESGLTRVSFHFPEGSNVVETISWEISDGELEQDLRYALNLYPSAKWNVTTREWISPHIIPSECYFQDQNVGVSIEYGKVRNEVSTISWWDTSRTIATTDKTSRKPPFEGAIHRDEWLKNYKWIPCQIPK